LLLRHRMAALQILTGREPGSGLRLALPRLATQMPSVCQRAKERPPSGGFLLIAVA